MTFRNSTPRGFTLIELMVTVVVIAVLAAIAAPSLIQFIRSSRLTAAANQFQGDLQLARREAIKRNARVLMCPVGTTAGQCKTATPFTAADWAAGWYVCYDADSNTQCDSTAANDPNPIVRRSAIDAATQVTLTGPTSIVRFNPDGSAAAAVTFTVAIAGKSYSGSVAATGHIAMTKPS
jgi:type IV fimbrial biogenesis protein FimT